MLFCYSIYLLKNLQVLDMSGSNLSEGLPDDIFTSLSSLRELNIESCKLRTLPSRCAMFYSRSKNSKTLVFEIVAELL